MELHSFKQNQFAFSDLFKIAFCKRKHASIRRSNIHVRIKNKAAEYKERNILKKKAAEKVGVHLSLWQSAYFISQGNITELPLA